MSLPYAQIKLECFGSGKGLLLKAGTGNIAGESWGMPGNHEESRGMSGNHGE